MAERRSLLHQSWRVLDGDCIPTMHAMMVDSVDAIVCDPPYGLEFMGKDWDRPWKMGKVADAGDADGTPFRRNAGTPSWSASGNPVCLNCGGTKYDKTRPNGCKCDAPKFRNEAAAQGRAFQEWCETWGREALRVLKPGGYLLAFGGTRTYHRLVSGLEDAGFEVRDQVAWIYGSGFPKHPSCLKPAHEPVVLARKASRYSEPLQIDAARIAGEPWTAHRATGLASTKFFTEGEAPVIDKEPHEGGRWPANVALDEDAAAALDAQSGTLTSGSGQLNRNADKFRTTYGEFKGGDEPADVLYGDSGGASRFFYCAKPDSAERNVGLGARNPHPTVKPFELMRWLCRLVTPKGGTVLDPFTGSGTTGIAAMREGFSFIGIEQSAEYAAVARARIVGDAPLINGALEEAA